jgi:hypothetical protein
MRPSKRWLGQRFGSWRRRSKPAKARRRRLTLEPLEARSLLAVTVTGLVTVGSGADLMIVRDAQVEIRAYLGDGSEVWLDGDTNQQGFYSITNGATFDPATRFGAEVWATGEGDVVRSAA